MSNEPRLPCSVLLIEDTPDLLEVLQKLLEVAGYAVITAETGQQAWDLLTSIRPGIIAPDIIVTDLRLPEFNGIELIRQIRETPELADIPIIAMSGEHEIALNEAIASGANLSLQKPVDPTDLAEAIERLLNRR